MAQVRQCAALLARFAKSTGTAVFLIGHVTKEGNLAGPRVLEHLVDTVLYFEGEAQSAFRILRAVKNRFGSTNEIGVFDMGQEGMKEVANLGHSPVRPPGGHGRLGGLLRALEGARPMLLTVEALVAKAPLACPAARPRGRTTTG